MQHQIPMMPSSASVSSSASASEPLSPLERETMVRVRASMKMQFEQWMARREISLRELALLITNTLSEVQPTTPHVNGALLGVQAQRELVVYSDWKYALYEIDRSNRYNDSTWYMIDDFRRRLLATAGLTSKAWKLENVPAADLGVPVIHEKDYIFFLLKLDAKVADEELKAAALAAEGKKDAASAAA